MRARGFPSALHYTVRRRLAEQSGEQVVALQRLLNGVSAIHSLLLATSNCRSILRSLPNLR